MTHLINFLIKLIATIVFIPVIGFCLLFLALIFWDGSFIDIANKVQHNMIWKKRQ